MIRFRYVLKIVIAHAFTIAMPFLNAHADPSKGFYIQQALDRYFTVPQDSQALATGGSSALSCDSSACIYLNPAGLAALDRFEFSGSIGNRSFEGDEFLRDDGIEQSVLDGYGVLSIPLFGGSFAIGFSRYQGDTDDEIDSTPDGHRRSFAYGISVNEQVSLGYSFTFYDDQLQTEIADLHSHARFLHIFGTQVKLADDLMLSGTFSLGVGQSDTEEFSIGSNGLSHLKQYAGAFGVRKSWDSLAFFSSVDFSHVSSDGDLVTTTPAVVIGGDESGNSYNVRLGGEYGIGDNWMTRLGLRWFEVIDYDFERPDLAELSGTLSGLTYSLGLGYRFTQSEKDAAPVRADYGVAWSDVGDGGWEHMVTLTVPFSV